MTYLECRKSGLVSAILVVDKSNNPRSLLRRQHFKFLGDLIAKAQDCETEAEWVYACRAGTETLYWSGNNPSSLWDVAWTARNSNQKPPKPVATRKANPFGLFDMHGNVSEWVHGGWTPDTYHRTVGPLSGDPRQDIPANDVRIFRGGSFYVDPVECRSAGRYAGNYGTWWIHTGFRVAISIDGVRLLSVTNAGAVAP